MSKMVRKSFVFVILFVLMGVTIANAETVTIWTKATEIMEDLYNQILLISTLNIVNQLISEQNFAFDSKTRRYALVVFVPSLLVELFRRQT